MLAASRVLHRLKRARYLSEVDALAAGDPEVFRKKIQRRGGPDAGVLAELRKRCSDASYPPSARRVIEELIKPQ